MIFDIVSLILTSTIAIAIYLLQSKLSDKETIDRRLEVEKEAGEKLLFIKQQRGSSKVQLYNSKLIGKKYFSTNKRSAIWGFPYHAAELYDLAFDGVEFVCGIEERSDKKYFKVGVIPYLRILKLQKNGDGSFNGPIFYVKPKLLQLDRYSMAYSSFRYYLVSESFKKDEKKPPIIRFKDGVKNIGLRLRYLTYYKWKFILRNK